jgi:heme/copper-type cytochrome/quinol oxidase subunit 4
LSLTDLSIFVQMSKTTAKFDWKIVKINIVQFVLSLYCYLHAKYRIEQRTKKYQNS